MGRIFLAGLVIAVVAVSGAAFAQTSVSVAVGGRSFMSFLPFELAVDLGYFKQEGLDVQINEFHGGSKAVEALVGGSADFSLGGLEHAVLLQAKGIDIKAIALFTKSHGEVLALKPELAKKYTSPRDLKGLKIGVTSPGSSMALALDLLLAKANVPTSDTPKIAIGGGPGAIAAAKSGRIDGVVLNDPVISVLTRDGDMVPVFDTRTEDGMKYLYGGFIAASTVLTTPKVIAEKRPAVKAFTKAIVHALQWLHTATPEQVASTVPPSFYRKDRKLYEEAVARMHDVYSTDGVIEPQFAANLYKALATHAHLTAKIDIAKTYDNSLVEGK